MYGNQKELSSRRIAILCFLFTASSIFLFIGWFIFGDAVQERLQREKFDPAAWQGHRVNDGVRIRMVDHMLRHHDFHGNTKQQVAGILREPDNTEYFNDWDMVYWLGPERGGFSIDDEWLVFRLDKRGNVVDYRVVRD